MFVNSFFYHFSRTSSVYVSNHEKGGFEHDDERSCARTMLQSQSAEIDLVCTKKYAAKALHQKRVVVLRVRHLSFAAAQSHGQISYGRSKVCLKIASKVAVAFTSGDFRRRT